MKASTLVKKIQSAIDKHGDMTIMVGLELIEKLKVKKTGPYSEYSSPATRNKCFIEVFYNDTYDLD